MIGLAGERQGAYVEGGSTRVSRHESFHFGWHVSLNRHVHMKHSMKGIAVEQKNPNCIKEREQTSRSEPIFCSSTGEDPCHAKWKCSCSKFVELSQRSPLPIAQDDRGTLLLASWNSKENKP